MTVPLPSAALARVVAVVGGAIAIIAAIITPLLPVNQTDATISWPQGQQLNAANASVTAPLVAVSPQELTAAIPCSVFSQVRSGSTVLSTLPAGADGQTNKALMVTVTGSTANVSFRGTPAGSASLADIASSRCKHLDISSSPAGVRAQFVGLGPVTQLGPDNRPNMSGIYTDLSTQQVQSAQGLRVNTSVDTRFNSSPGVVKLVVEIVGVLALIVALAALARLDWLGGYHRRVGVRSWRRILAPRISDMAVTAVMVIWLFLGAGTPDDGYILGMGRGAGSQGYLSDYYRWYGIPEAPFDWYYSLLGHWSSISTSGLWMHIPALIAALLSWFILGRVLLPRMGSAVRNSGWAIWAAAAVFTAFWMPFNSGLRSETLIVAGSLLTWWAAEQAIATRRLLPAAGAALCATMTFALAPHGIIAVAILIVSARPMLRVVIARRREHGLLAAIAPIAAAGLFTLFVMFRDQTVASVYNALRIRYSVGPNLSWHQEYFRYFFITVTTDDGALTRRVPVLLLFAALFVALAVMLRRKRIRGVDPGPAWRAIGAVLVTMVLLIFAPTKWTIQFGIYAGIAAAIAAVATVAIAQSAARTARNLAVFAAGLLFALAAAMAGQNAWSWAYSWGITWFDRAPEVAGKPVSTLLLALAVITSAIAVWLHLRMDFSAHRGVVHDGSANVDAPVHVSSTRDRRRLVLASSPIAIIAVIMVVAELAVFAKAYVGRGNEYTVASANLRALSGDTCALANKVLLEPDPNKGMLAPADGKSVADALAGDGAVGFSPNGIASDLSPDAMSSKPGQMNVDGVVSNPFAILGNAPGTLGGRGARTVNGSTAALPYGLNPATTPVLGSYGYNSGKASLTSGWYALPKPGSTPLFAITAAGAIASVGPDGISKFGRFLRVEFGDRGPDGTFTVVGPRFQPLDAGPRPPNMPWRDLRIPATAVPREATAMRIVATDDNLTPDQWLAITPPRATQLVSLDHEIGTKTPTLIDFSAASQFPCQQPITATDGVMEVPRWRILPDRITALSQSKTWMAADDGGLLSVSEGTTNPVTVPSYLDGDWGRDWGSVQRLSPLAPLAAPARITTGERSRWGLTRQPSNRVVANNES